MSDIHKKSYVMNIEIRENLTLKLYGLSGQVKDLKFGETGVALMDKMWKVIDSNNLPHKGINIWVYDDKSNMFTGVEMHKDLADSCGLEFRDVTFRKYAWYLHVGPYELLFDANRSMWVELEKQGLKPCAPSAEIYGDHGPDKNKLETQIIYTLA